MLAQIIYGNNIYMGEFKCIQLITTLEEYKIVLNETITLARIPKCDISAGKLNDFINELKDQIFTSTLVSCNVNSLFR